MQKHLPKILFLLVLLDFIYSFFQYYGMPLDGDLAAIVLPADWYRHVLADPFGFDIVSTGKGYGGAGRFFCHWSMSSYFLGMPKFLQLFFSPVESVYLSSAIFKIAIQLALVWAFATAICGKLNPLKSDFILAAILIVPLFQANGYHFIIGLVEKSPTYAFFYSFPLAIGMFYFLPFYLFLFFDKKINWKILTWFYLLPISVFLSFSGPLVPAVSIIIGSFLLVNSRINLGRFRKREFGWRTVPTLPNLAQWSLVFLIVLSFYSLVLGRANVEQIVAEAPSLLTQYGKMSIGLFRQFTQKLAYPLLTLAIAFNYRQIGRSDDQTAKKVKLALDFAILFSIIYLLLLPLGGFRTYRLFVVRHDTMMPVTIAVFYMFGISTFYLLKNNLLKNKQLYVIFTALFLLMFALADEPKFAQNKCEKSALYILQDSKEKKVFINSDCQIMSWNKITNPNDSWLNVQMLKRWHILQDDKLYFQKK